MNNFIGTILIILFVLGIAILLGCMVKIEPQNKKTLGEAVQEFLGDEQAYEENVRAQQAQFPILYSKVQGALDIFTRKGYFEDVKEWARHMYRLGWLSGIDVYMIFSRYGNVFEEEEEEQDGSEPIRQYAMEVLSNLIESKEFLEENEKAHIKQLLAEMQALGWYSHNDRDDFESFVSKGADALIGEHLLHGVIL